MCVCVTMHVCECVCECVQGGHQLISETDGVGPDAGNPIRSLKPCDRPRSRKYDLIKRTLRPCAGHPVPEG